MNNIDSTSTTTTTTTTDTTTATATTSHHPIPLDSTLPQVLTRSFTVLNVNTDAWIQIFADRIFVGMSQLECKIGTYILCEAETSDINPRQTEFKISTLLGNRDDAMLGVYARTLMERIRSFHGSSEGERSTMPKELLLGIALDKAKGRDPKMFQLLLGVLVDMYVDAVKDTSTE